MANNAILLGIEFATLFLALPLAYRYLPLRISPLPVLWIATLYCWWILCRDPAFPMANLWNLRAGLSQLPNIFAIWVVFAIGLGLCVRLFAPELLFTLIRARPGLWALVMVLYPILSVYPQSLVYRAFLMHRYAPILAATSLAPATQNVLAILISAVAFAFMHLIFRNPLAVVLTFVGGILFAWRYQATGSLAISAFEHALYGCLLFTIGLGQYFYHGTARFAEALAPAAANQIH